MQEGMDIDTARSGSVDGPGRDRYAEAQFRKTELRRHYQDHAAADHIGQLMLTIERDVIPRLVSARAPVVDVAARKTTAPDSALVSAFAKILLGHDKTVEPPEFIDDVRADGWSVEHIYLDLLAPAARRIGALWDDDECTFVDVTFALGTLHRLMLSLSADFRFEHRRIDPERRVLLVQPWGSEHTFGVRMVAEFFKRGAWTVDLPVSLTAEALSQLVEAEWFTVVGFSVACEANLTDLRDAITIVRTMSANPAVGILVGGPAFVDHPDYVARVGADRMAADAIQAVIEAERFVLRTP